LKRGPARNAVSPIDDARVIDKNVETAVFVRDRGGSGGYARPIEEVEKNERGVEPLRGQVRDRGIATFGISRADDDADSGLRELARDL
jgi:hypothetical protein